MGAVCGDGRCNSNIGESAATCPRDCATSKGCCAVRNGSSSNTSAAIDCSLYSTIKPSTASSACSAKAGCKVFQRADMNYSVCIRDLSYDQNRQTLNSSSYKTCADITDSSTCNSSNSCVWVGQLDSPSCSNYCGSGHDGNKTDTFLTCPEEYAKAGDGMDQCRDGDNTFLKNNILNTFDAKKCPLAAGYTNADGTAMSYSSGCGDGVCSLDEQGNAASSECWRDCGYYKSIGGAGADFRVDWGECASFATICPTLTTSDKCLATHICSWSGTSCSISSDNIMKTSTGCSLAKNRIDCNRIGCYWDRSDFNYCGDGACNMSDMSGVGTQETEVNCPIDCFPANRTYYCQGLVVCAGKTDMINCGNTAGCQWSKAGAYTN